jgi:hypothetical protein
MLRLLGTGPGFASNLFTTYMNGGALADLSLVTGPAWAGSMGGSVGGRERKVHKILADSFLQNIPSEIDMLMIPDGTSSSSLALAKLLYTGTCSVSDTDKDIIQNVINCVGEGFDRRRALLPHFQWKPAVVTTACVRPPHLAISPLSSSGLAFKTTINTHGISLQHSSPVGQKLSCSGDGASAPAPWPGPGGP